MSRPWWRFIPGFRDTQWKIAWWLVIILVIVVAVILTFILISATMGCDTVTECLDLTGIGGLFSRVPFLLPLCIGFLILGAVAAVLFAVYWRMMLDRRGDPGQHVRRRLPPEDQEAHQPDIKP